MTKPLNIDRTWHCPSCGYSLRCIGTLEPEFTRLDVVCHCGARWHLSARERTRGPGDERKVALVLDGIIQEYPL